MYPIIAPRLTINGGESLNVTFEEERGQLPLFSGADMVSITDSDSTHLTEATLILEPGGDSSMESLLLNTSALPQGITVPQSNYQSEQGFLTITGDYTTVEYESILSAVNYISTNKNPDDTMTPIVTCRVRDASNLWSNNLTVIITIMAFNDPPMIYLGGPLQLNYSVTLPDTGSDGLPITNQVQFQDPDTTEIQSIQIVLELQTTNGDMVDLNQESLISPIRLLQQDSMNRNVYNLDSLGTSSHSSFGVVLSQVGYRNLNPSAVAPGTRVVRVTAMDVEHVTSAGSRLPGIMSQPSFTFIHVGDEPLTPTTSADSNEQLTQPTTTEIELDTTSTSVLRDTTNSPPLTTSADSNERQTQPTTTEIEFETTSTSVLTVPTDSTTTTAYVTTTTTDHNPMLTCPEELNLPLISESTLGLVVYNWTQTPVEEDHLGQPCPMVGACPYMG